MSRSRKISTEISRDKAINKLAMEHGDFAALFYTWMIPHTKDDGIIEGDPEEIMYLVIPARRDKTPADIVAALEAIESVKAEVRDERGHVHKVPLIRWDRRNNRVIFPATPYYKFQTYINKSNRRLGWEEEEFPGLTSSRVVVSANFGEEDGVDADINRNQQESAENTVSLSPSLSPSLSLSSRDNASPTEIEHAKVAQVLAIMPTKRSQNAKSIVREAVRKFHFVPIEDTVQCMRMVLDKFNTAKHKDRTDWASLFANQLMWQSKYFELDIPVGTKSVAELDEQREQDRARAQRKAVERLAQMEEEVA